MILEIVFSENKGAYF